MVKNIVKKQGKILFLILIVLPLTACWDAIEIDDRAYVMALGIDKFEASEIEEPQGRQGAERDEGGNQITANIPKESPRNRFSFTYVISNVEFLVGESDVPNVLYNTIGENLYAASRIMSTRMNRQVFFGHMKTLIIGETIARDSDLFREVLDSIERHPLISRRVNIAIAPGIARNVLEVEPQINPVTGEFLSQLFLNKDRSPRGGSSVIGDIFQDVHCQGNTIIPRVIPGKNDIKVAGAAVIRNFQMQGWLGEVETRSVEILKGTARPGGLSVYYHIENPKELYIVPVDLTYLSRKIHLLEAKDKIKLLIEIKTEGEIEQFYFNPRVDLLEPEVIREIEEKISEKLEKELKYTIEKLQKEFKADVIGISRYLKSFHPKVWTQVKDDWNEIFPLVDIEVKAKTKMRQMGLTK